MDWLVTTDGCTHPTRIWTGGIDKRPVVLYLHGIEGHGRWFEGTAVKLSAAGIWVYAPDRRGAGLSNEAPGHLNNWQQYVCDIGDLEEQIRKRHPGAPIYIVANCWSARAALVHASSMSGKRLAGLVMTSPAVRMKVDMPLKGKIEVALAYLSGAGTSKRFPIPLVPEDFTDNAPYVDYIANDQYRLLEATAPFFAASMKLNKLADKALSQVHLPILVLQSGNDRIVDSKKIERWFDRIESSEKKLVMFPDFAHSLDFDPNAAEYQKVLLDWLLAPRHKITSGMRR